MYLAPHRPLVPVLLALLLVPAARAADPTDNPVATFYSGPEGYPAWTDTFRWSNVINMKTYPKGKTAYEKFENARGELVEGGGVLYYPAGTYDFSTMPPGVGLNLVPGVVIRGEAPSGRPVAADGKLELPTKFVFNFRNRGGGKVPGDWNFIGVRPDDGKNIKTRDMLGVAWVQFTGATVAWGPQVDWGKTWGTANSLLSASIKKPWAAREPSGTHPIDALAGGGKKYAGAGRGRLVFGCVFEDAAVLDDFSDPGYGPDGFHASQFGARIVAYGSRVFVANNVLPHSRKSFAYRQKTDKQAGATVRFDYDNTCGIDINKSLLLLAGANGTCPGYFEEGVVVRDNYVFNHGHTGFSVAGKWVTITGNNNDRALLRAGDAGALTLDGYEVAGPNTDTRSRAFDLAGRNLWADRNRFTNIGSVPGGEGDGIVGGAPNSTPIFSWALTHNIGTRGTGLPALVGGRDVTCRGLLVGWNTNGGPVGCALGRGEPALADCAFVGNKADRVVPDTKTVAKLKLDPPMTAAGSDLAAPMKVTATVYQKDAVEVTWTGGGTGAVGFRVERRIAGGKWQVIAYRPPRPQGDAENPRAWVDFTAPPGKELTYRVVALDGDDTDKNASEPTLVVTL